MLLASAAHRSRWILGLVGALCTPLLAPASGQAATVRLGPSVLSASGTSIGCGSCTHLQTSLPEAGVLLTAPADGVITQWRVRGVLFGDGVLRLRVLRPAPVAGLFSGFGTSAPATAVDGTPLATSLTIQAGDSIGLDSTASPTMGNGATIALVSGVGSYSTFTPPLVDGGTIGPTGHNSAQLDFNADVVLAAPAVDSLSPAVGSGGQVVTISGRHLVNASAVSFGAVPAGIVSTSNTQVVVIAPTQPAGTVDVSVTTLGGTNAPSSAAKYVYAGPAGGGTGAGGTGTPGAGTSAKARITTSVPSRLKLDDALQKGITVVIRSSLRVPASVALFQGRGKKAKVRRSLRLRASGPTKVVLRPAKLTRGAFRVTITVQGRTFTKRGTLIRSPLANPAAAAAGI
jgi:IPT/TIG domain